MRKTKSLSETLRILISWRMIITLLMGFSSGLPLLTIGSTLQAWMTEEGVNLKVIGMFSLVGLPYTLKFLWAPFLDRFVPPFLGRRRGWLLVSQLCVMISLLVLGNSNPAASPISLAIIAMAVAFWSATQDIGVDAYRRELLPDPELGLGSSLYVLGYRGGLLFSGAFALFLADQISWERVYFWIAMGMGIGILVTLLAPEPKVTQGLPKTMKEAVVEPFREFFKRKEALWILSFILFYKIGDNMASQMTIPFLLKMAYTKSQIAAVAKTFGMISMILGGLFGGTLILRLGMFRSLWFFGILQAVSTASFSFLAISSHALPLLAGVIAFENLTSGMGTAAFVGFMAALCDRRFTATQYALLTSLMGIPRVLSTAPSGYFAQWLGWEAYFLMCALIAIPGLWILVHLKKVKEIKSI